MVFGRLELWHRTCQIGVQVPAKSEGPSVEVGPARLHGKGLRVNQDGDPPPDRPSPLEDLAELSKPPFSIGHVCRSVHEDERQFHHPGGSRRIRPEGPVGCRQARSEAESGGEAYAAVDLYPCLLEVLPQSLTIESEVVAAVNTHRLPQALGQACGLAGIASSFPGPVA
jgi:hypothetical protein